MDRRSPWPRTRPGRTPGEHPGYRSSCGGHALCPAIGSCVASPRVYPYYQSIIRGERMRDMSATREITKQGRDGTSVRLLPLSKDPFQPPTDPDMLPSERREMSPDPPPGRLLYVVPAACT